MIINKIAFVTLLAASCFGDTLSMQKYLNICSEGSSKNVMLRNAKVFLDTDAISGELLDSLFYINWASRVYNGNNIKICKLSEYHWGPKISDQFIKLMRDRPLASKAIDTAILFRKKAGKKAILMGIGLLAMPFSIAMSLSNGHSDYYYWSGIGLMCGSVFCISFGWGGLLWDDFHVDKYLAKSIYYHNGEVLSTSRQN